MSSPIVILNIPIELYIIRPTVVAKQLADVFLQGWRNETRTVAAHRSESQVPVLSCSARTALTKGRACSRLFAALMRL